MPAKKNIPFDFIFDYLPSSISIKPAFGMYFIYLDSKIILVLCKRQKAPELNGVWIGTYKEFHTALMAEIPGAKVLNENPIGRQSSWLLLPASCDNFEQGVLITCELISKHDYRIGKPISPA